MLPGPDDLTPYTYARFGLSISLHPAAIINKINRFTQIFKKCIIDDFLYPIIKEIILCNALIPFLY